MKANLWKLALRQMAAFGGGGAQYVDFQPDRVTLERAQFSGHIKDGSLSRLRPLFACSFSISYDGHVGVLHGEPFSIDYGALQKTKALTGGIDAYSVPASSHPASRKSGSDVIVENASISVRLQSRRTTTQPVFEEGKKSLLTSFVSGTNTSGAWRNVLECDLRELASVASRILSICPSNEPRQHLNGAFFEGANQYYSMAMATDGHRLRAVGLAAGLAEDLFLQHDTIKSLALYKSQKGIVKVYRRGLVDTVVYIQCDGFSVILYDQNCLGSDFPDVSFVQPDATYFCEVPSCRGILDKLNHAKSVCDKAATVSIGMHGAGLLLTPSKGVKVSVAALSVAAKRLDGDDEPIGFDNTQTGVSIEYLRDALLAVKRDAPVVIGYEGELTPIEIYSDDTYEVIMPVRM